MKGLANRDKFRGEDGRVLRSRISRSPQNPSVAKANSPELITESDRFLCSSNSREPVRLSATEILR